MESGMRTIYFYYWIKGLIQNPNNINVYANRHQEKAGIYNSQNFVTVTIKINILVQVERHIIMMVGYQFKIQITLN